MADEAQDQPQGSPQMPEPSFANFIATLRLQVFVCLGQVPNPATQKPEKDLGQAKYLIDTLQILEQKTQGNLDETEKTLLDTVLYEARMRYVEACGTMRPV